MSTPIAIAEVGDSPGSVAWTGDATAQQLSRADATCTLRFRLIAEAESLEALRYARRSMLREEWTRGTDDGEPSLEEAIFSAFEVVWTVPADERDRCRAKITELVERANRALGELAPR